MFYITQSFGLKVLILSNDSLQRIEAGILHGPNRSSSVKHLDFQKNPWTCDCSTLEFATFIRQQTKSFKVTINVIFSLLHLSRKYVD